MSPVNVVAVDIGGTFTDLVVQRPLRVRQVLKLPTTTDRPEIAVLRAVRALGLTGTSEVVHATTLATNSLLTPTERLLRSVGLLTTEGFRDVLEIGRQNRPSLYDLNFSRPRPLVASENRREVSERTNAAGTIVRPAHEPELRSTSAKLKRNGVRSLAISFLHSYKNPTNERRAAAAARRLFPHVSASSEIAPEPREFERTSTVVVNAVLMPVVSDYLSRLQEGLASLGVRQVSVMASSGGLVDPREAAARPVQIVESGPAAGVVAAAALARRLGVRSVISFDMGGTTAKAGTVFRGHVELAPELEIGGGSHHGRPIKGSGYPIRFPVVDLSEVSAGGGTIIRRDPAGTLRIGPGSAGATPGPIAYRRGGRLPTLTDANLTTGVLPPFLLGGALPLDAAAARAGLGRLGSAIEVAEEAVQLANLEMARAIRMVTTERGLDPAQFTLVGFGGAGPQHAAALAEEIGVRDLLVPRDPGVFSAMGLLQADWRYEARTAFPRHVPEALARLRATLRRRVHADRFLASADCRYRGQGYELSVPVVRPTLEAISRDFVRLHARTYGFRLNSEVEVVTLRAFAVVPRPKSHPRYRPSGRPDWAERQVVWRGRELCVATAERDRLPAGTRVAGPAAIEEYGTTTFVPPGWRLRVERGGELHLHRRAR